MREVTIYFGGKERHLWFDARDGIAIKKMLGKRPKQVLDENIVPADDKGTYRATDIDIESLAIVLWCGVSHLDKNTKHDPAITTDVVIDWLSEYMETASLVPLASAIEDALYLSGILGTPVDLKKISGEVKAAAVAPSTPEAVQSGKEQAPSVESQTT